MPQHDDAQHDHPQREDTSADDPAAELPTDALEPPALVTALEAAAEEVPPETIDEVWIFPPHRAAGVETAVAVFALLPGDEGLRRIITLHYSATRDRRGRLGVEHAMDEHGAAAAVRMGRIIDGVLRRLDAALPPEPPRRVRTGGELRRWAELVEELRTRPPVASGGATRYQ